jgi:hypothetical protein
MISSVRHGSATAALNSFFDPKPLGAFFLFLRCCYDGSDPCRAGIAVIYFSFPRVFRKMENIGCLYYSSFFRNSSKLDPISDPEKDPEDNFVSTISIDSSSLATLRSQFGTLSDAADDALGSLQTGNFLTTCEGRCNLRVAKKLCWQAAQTRGYISKLMKGFARICREGPKNKPEPKKSPLDRYTEKELGKVCQGCREVLASQCEHVATKVDSRFQEVMVEHYATSL